MQLSVNLTSYIELLYFEIEEGKKPVFIEANDYKINAESYYKLYWNTSSRSLANSLSLSRNAWLAKCFKYFKSLPYWEKNKICRRVEYDPYKWPVLKNLLKNNTWEIITRSFTSALSYRINWRHFSRRDLKTYIHLFDCRTSNKKKETHCIALDRRITQDHLISCPM